MKEMVISIKGFNDVYSFLKQARTVKGDVIVKRGVYCADAKSILGILCIDMSQGVTIMYPESAIKFEYFIKQFKVDR